MQLCYFTIPFFIALLFHLPSIHAVPSLIDGTLPYVRNVNPSTTHTNRFHFWGDTHRNLLMINGTTYDSFISSFYMQPGTTSKDYLFRFASNDSAVLDAVADVSVSQTMSSDYVNISTEIDFQRFPGMVRLALEARQKLNQTLVHSLSIHFLVAGMVIYEPQSNLILSGFNASLTIPTYNSVLNSPHWDLAVFVQFPNATNSSHVFPQTNLAPSFPSYLSQINATLMRHSGEILWDESECSITDGEWNGTSLPLKRGCGFGISHGLLNGSVYDGFHFAFDFEPYRSGRFGIFFEWNTFTVGTDLEDELFTNYIWVNILGEAPIVVRRIEPSNPFSMEGGEHLYVEMINAVNVNITSFDVNDVPFRLLSGSRQYIDGPDDFYETAKFVTEPGTGKNLPWSITGTHMFANNTRGSAAQIVDQTGFLFSYNNIELQISVHPNDFPEIGGTLTIISGNLSSFSPSNDDHVIHIGNVVLDKKYYDLPLKNVSDSYAEIWFYMPPRLEIGPGWEYELFVQMGASKSDNVPIVYQPSILRLTGQTFGASSGLESDIVIVGSCGNTTFMTTLESHDSNGTVYQWSLLNASSFDLLTLPNASSLLTNLNTLELPNEFFPHYHTLYEVVSNVTLDTLQQSYSFYVKRIPKIVVGVTLIESESRTIANPPVNLRIVAKVEVPHCFTNVTSLSYEWEYEDKAKTIATAERLSMLPVDIHELSKDPAFEKFPFSYLNNTGTNDTTKTPTRLGREFVVPREELQYGLHRIRLTVRANNFSDMLGSAVSSVSIRESPLIAMIDTGQLMKKITDEDDIVISGENSFDPDILFPANASEGLVYEWSCKFSLYANLSEPKSCGEHLLPLRKGFRFTVNAAALQDISSQSIEDEALAQVYLQYSLTVRKQDRERTSSQTICVVKSSGQRMATYERVEIINSRSQPINPDFVEFWDDVIIRPVASPTTQWRFRLELPLLERSVFFAGNTRIITTPGYYTTTGSSAPGFQQLPLGILADKLQPRQVYQFSISFQETGLLSNDISIRLKTADVPLLLFPPLAKMNGTVHTIFRATATTSFGGNATFSYQFYLLEVNKKTREYCIDGCTGAKTVQFQVAKPGEYVVQCRLLAANGKTLLSVKNNTESLRVSQESSAVLVGEFDTDIDKDFMLGDDGGVNQKGFFVAQSMHEKDDQVVVMSGDDGSIEEESCGKYTRKWAKMSQAIIRNELPNTANARNYVSVASNYARLKCVEHEETLYDLLSMVHEAIARTPSEEALTSNSFTGGEGVPKVDLEQELLRFYNYSMTRAFSSIAAGSSRGRMIPTHGEVSNLVLDLSEMWMKHLTTTAANGRVCGWQASYNSSLGEEGESDQVLAPTRAEYPLGVSTIKVAVICNKEQGMSLKTPFASFEWCDIVYSLGGDERKYFTIAESFDFPYLSGIQGDNKSDTSRLVMVDITTLGKSNQLVSALSGDLVTAQDEGENEEPKTCYRIGMQMSKRVMGRSGHCSRNVPYRMWPRKEYGQQISSPFEAGAYQRLTDGISATAETRNNSVEVTAQSNILGLYGAYQTSCALPGELVGNEIAIVGILIGILLLILIITLLTYLCVTMVVTGRRGNWGREDEYLERDYFGRKEVTLNFTNDYDSTSGTTGQGDSQSTRSAADDGTDRGSVSDIRINGMHNDENMMGVTKQEIMASQPPS